MKKEIVSVLTLFIVSMSLSAADTKDTALLAGGKASGEIRVFHVLNDTQNKFTPYDGSAYLGKLKYTTKDLGLQGLKASALGPFLFQSNSLFIFL